MEAETSTLTQKATAIQAVEDIPTEVIPAPLKSYLQEFISSYAGWPVCIPEHRKAKILED